MKLAQFLQEQLLLMDGAMGTYYQQLPGHKEEISELANKSEPERILEIHTEYLQAGADLIRTNTFAANSVVLPMVSAAEREELLRAGCRIAKKAVAAEQERSLRPCFAAADIGPIAAGGERGEEEILAEYYRMCDIFLEEGMDIFWLETFQGTEAISQILAYVKERAPEAFLAVSFCINKNGFTTSGQKAERLLFAEELELADAVGFNCGIGSVHLKSVLGNVRFPKERFVLAAPNAGYAEAFSSRAAFLNSAGYFAENMVQIADLGADIVGGCCGTMPTFLRETKTRLEQQKKKQSLSETRKCLKNRVSLEAYHTSARKDTEKAASQQTEGTGQETPKNPLKEKLLRGEKIIAVELDPPFDADGTKLLACAKMLSGYPVDVLTFADSPMGRSRADSVLTALHINRQTGMQVVPHISCRDRNVIAMRSLLLGAYMSGLRNLLIVTGDPVPGDDRKNVTGVFDYNSIRFMKQVSDMNTELFPEDGFFFGGALNYNFPNAEQVAERIRRKQEAGASFFLTQPIFSKEDVERIAWLKEQTGANIIGGILPPVSKRNALFIRNEMAGMNIPDEILACYRDDMTREEGEETGARIAKQVMEQLAPYVAGYYFMLPFNRVGLIERIFRRPSQEENGKGDKAG
ncbi:MAG: bifunctional homocysteine S-methyltransferase/methylenetetrahydrofolate reductase [Lachnospiraceae bacterium]